MGVTNRNILQSIKTKLEKAKGSWAEELPTPLWSYRTTPRGTIGETPFLLTYGLEAVVPTELAQPTYRVLNYNDARNTEALREELDLIEEKKDKAYLKMDAYKQRVSQYFNK